MAKTTIITVILCVAAGILQSTLLSGIALYRAVPDIALCIVVFSAYVNGSMTGQVSGFFSGLLLDFMSAAPLGLNCLVRTIIGAFAGIKKGAFFLDAFFLPMILCALATLFKAFLFFILHLIFPGVPAYPIAAPVLWVELGMNCLCAPLLFAALKRIKPLNAGKGN
jgi:rod shape-determining protein MreD